MEQRKIKWILAAVSAFVLIVFGFALIRFSPSKSSGVLAKQAISIKQPSTAPVSQTKQETNTLDPDKWARNPENTPGLDTPITPAPGSVHLTIVNGDNTAANYGNIDVSALTRGTTVRPGQVEQNLKIPGQESAADAVTTSPTASPTDAQVSSTSTTIKSTATATSATVTTTTSAKPAPKQNQTPEVKKTTASVSVKPAPLKTVTEYWIQTGSFTSKLNAEKARETLNARYLKAEIFTKDVAGKTSYRVRVGPYTSKKEAEYWLGTVTGIPSFTTSYISEVKTKK